MASTSPIDLLRKACIGDLSTNSSLSKDGKTLTLLGSPHDAKTPHQLTLNDGKGGTKTVSYTLASIYLQLLNQSVLKYRKACEAGGVADPVKILDKAHISDYFLDAGAAGGKEEEEDDAAEADAGGADSGADGGDGSAKKDGEDAMDMSEDDDAAADDDDKREIVQFSSSKHHDEKKQRHRSGSSSGHRDKDHSRGRDKDRSSRSSSRHHGDHHHRSHSKSKRSHEDNDDRRKSSGKSGSSNKAPMVPITNEQLVANLSTIVDKRDTATSTQGKKEEDGKEEEGGGGTATAATTSDAATTIVDSRETTPATTPAPTDDEGGPPLLTTTTQQSTEESEKKETEDRELLLKWLSPAGFQVDSPTVAAAIEADRDAVRRITALEIPVGDSASILRAGAGGEIVEKVGGGGGAAAAAEAAAATPTSGGGGVKKRDFARVLDIYQEVVVAEEKAKRTSSSSSSKKRPPPPPSGHHKGKSPRTSSSRSSTVTGSSGGGTSTKSSSSKKPTIESNPIIIVPNAMTSVITMINAGLFLGKDATYVPRQQAMGKPNAGKRGGTFSITRKLNARLGGGTITYDIIDNPTTRLKKGEDWNKVVAVICQGASWQFKGWRYSDPVDLFSRTFGFYVGLEGAAVPNELQGWNVKIGKLSRDRRGSDNVCLASFWNGLEEFMAVHKQGLFKS